VPHLGHRVMDPTAGTEPVGARVEIRLEDRLQHQLQGRLDHPVADRADPQAAALGRARFRDQPLPRRQRAETAVLQTAPQRAEELLHAPRLDGCGRVAVHPGGLRALVAPHPSPADQEEGGIGDKVEQVAEPAMRVINGPAVQFGLDLQYPALSHVYGLLQLVGIHQRPPGIPASSLHDLLASFAMCAPFARPDYYEASAPPAAISRHRACPPPGWRPGGEGSRRRFPRSLRIVRPGRRPAIPRQRRRAYAAGFQRGLLTVC
jgi:hypothetical protein